ncbi:hypothetical protein M0805_009077 [Coniferiporia weirii]|nr:hypothetical protein M0805_009077 [Coniferiporia weirii]
MRENCLKEFDSHWDCLEKNNQEYYLCRKPERTLNKCMFEKLGLTKTVPDTPEGKTPIHLVDKPVFKAIQKEQLSPHRSVYVSNSTNPYFNLSLEDWLFRNKPHQEPLLLLYRDDPCVVIGRNQNPWKEVNLQLASVQTVPFIRRRSGGGTVYHDLGNTNYSLHLPRSAFDRNETAKVVVRAVRALGIDAYVNERNDVCAGGYKMSTGLYVSSSCYADILCSLGDLLHTTKETMITKGVASVRSPVQNLQQFNPEVTHEDFVDAVIRSFRDEYGIREEAEVVEEDEVSLAVPAIRNGMVELKGWDWLYGQTPEFTYSVSQRFEWGEATAEITSKHGIILSCKIHCQGFESDALEALDKRMRGLKYGFIGELEENYWREAGSNLPRIQEMWNWIREETSS